MVKLNELRIRKNKTLQEVSNETGISVPLLSKYETGKQRINLKNKQILETYYQSKFEYETHEEFLEKKVDQLEKIINKLIDELAEQQHINAELESRLAQIAIYANSREEVVNDK